MAQSESKRKYPKLHDEDWLRKKYIAEGLTQREIAEIVGCSNSHIHYRLDAIDISAINRDVKPLLPRFWESVDESDKDDCWEWEGNITASGYGTIGIAGEEKKAHRIAYHLDNKGIPAGKQINHHCDNRKCVNPNHLYAGTQSDNVQDAWDRDRMPEEKESLRGSKNGNSKIDKSTATRIKELLTTDRTNEEISEFVGVSIHIVNDISSEKTWTYL